MKVMHLRAQRCASSSFGLILLFITFGSSALFLHTVQQRDMAKMNTRYLEIELQSQKQREDELRDISQKETMDWQTKLRDESNRVFGTEMQVKELEHNVEELKQINRALEVDLKARAKAMRKLLNDSLHPVVRKSMATKIDRGEIARKACVKANETAAPDAGDALPKGRWCLLQGRATLEDVNKRMALQKRRNVQVLPIRSESEDEQFAEGLMQLIEEGEDVVDFGAGLAPYRRFLKRSLPTGKYHPFDQAIDVDCLTNDSVAYADLRRPVKFVADWVFAMDVGERVLKRHSKSLVENLIKNARVGVVLSWGRPRAFQSGQQGVGNDRSIADLLQDFTQADFKQDERAQAALRAAASHHPWLLKTLLVFRRIAVSTKSAWSIVVNDAHACEPEAMMPGE